MPKKRRKKSSVGIKTVAGRIGRLVHPMSTISGEVATRTALAPRFATQRIRVVQIPDKKPSAETRIAAKRKKKRGKRGKT